jgi:hypothetical protein
VRRIVFVYHSPLELVFSLPLLFLELPYYRNRVHIVYSLCVFRVFCISILFPILITPVPHNRYPITCVLYSCPSDAKGLLLASIRCPDPVIFFEPKILYRSAVEEVILTLHFHLHLNQLFFYLLPCCDVVGSVSNLSCTNFIFAANVNDRVAANTSQVPVGDYEVEIGKAKIVTPGTHVTVVGWGNQVNVLKKVLYSFFLFVCALSTVNRCTAPAQAAALIAFVFARLHLLQLFNVFLYFTMFFFLVVHSPSLIIPCSPISSIHTCTHP